MNVAFTLISFALLKWDECLSVQVEFELPVQLLLELEANRLVQNVNELQFELSRMYLDETIPNLFDHSISPIFWVSIARIQVSNSKATPPLEANHSGSLNRWTRSIRLGFWASEKN